MPSINNFSSEQKKKKIIIKIKINPAVPPSIPLAVLIVKRFTVL
jgi:hypothetical protein